MPKHYYKKPKNLKLKKIDTSVVKPKKGVDTETKMSLPKGLKIKKAPVNVKMMTDEKKPKSNHKSKQGEIKHIKQQSKAIKGTGSLKGYRRLEQEPTTEVKVEGMYKEALEKGRYSGEKKIRDMIKGIGKKKKKKKDY